MEIFIIQQTFYWLNTNEKLEDTQVIYAVSTEEEARQDCRKLQTKSNKEFNGTYKMIYTYKRINLY